MTGKIGESEEKIAELLLIFFFGSRSKLLQLLVNLVIDELDIGPVEANLGGLRLELYCAGESRKCNRHIVQSSVLTGLPFPCLRVLPEVLCQYVGPCFFIAKDMRMPTQHL